MTSQRISDNLYRKEDLQPLYESAYKKCLLYFLGLNFSTEKQKKLQDHLRNWSWKLIYYVYTNKPGNYNPWISFFVKVEWIDMPQVIEQEAWNGAHFDFKNDLKKYLTEEEIYSLIYQGINDNIKIHTDSLITMIGDLTLDQPRNPDYTEWDIAGKHLDDARTGLKQLQDVTQWKIWSIIQL